MFANDNCQCWTTGSDHIILVGLRLIFGPVYTSATTIAFYIADNLVDSNM